jgi:hypothetical protein
MTTPLYGLELLGTQQAQPETFINENFRRVEAILSRVLSRSVDDPSGLSPSEGDSYIVAAASFAIVGVDTSGEVFRISGDQTGRLQVGETIEVSGSTGNDGTYTIDALNYDGTNDETDITVKEDVTDGTVDGDVLHVAGAWNGERQSVAYWQGSAWLFVQPFEGAGPLWVNSEDAQIRYDGTEWARVEPGVDVEDSGSVVIQKATNINFDANLTVTDDGDGTVSVSGSSAGVDAEDDGSVIVSGSTAFNFGSNLSVTDDGDGTVTVDSAGGTGSITWNQVSSSFAASVNTRYLADTSGGAFTITMPASPSVGDTVYFADAARSWGTNNLTVDGNGNNVVGNTTLEVDVTEWNFSLIYNGTQWVFGDTSGNLFQSPENATDSGTDAYVSDSTTSTPTAGVVISRDFQSANTTTTPTLDGNSIVTREGSSLWDGAINGVHELKWDGGNYRVRDAIGYLPSVNGGPLGFRNALINGDFRINQREVATGSALSLSDGEYFFDRWKSAGATSGIQVATDGTVTLGSNEGIEQVVEGRGSDSIGWSQTGDNVTVSVSDPSANLTVTLLDYSETDSNSGTINSGAGRQSVTLTVPALDTDGHLVVRVEDASGSGADFSQVQLEEGDVATPFEKRPVGEELALCQRYFWKSGGSNYAYHGTSNTDNSTEVRCLVVMPVTMRGVPSVSGAGAFQHEGNLDYNVTFSKIGSGTGEVNEELVLCVFSGSGMNSGVPGRVRSNNDPSAYINYDAEL